MTADPSPSALLTAPGTHQGQTIELARALDVQVGTHSVPERFLYAHATRGEVIQHVRTQASAEDRDRLPRIIADWDALQPRIRALQISESRLPDTIKIMPLPAEAQAFAAATIADPLVAKTFESWNHEIAMVEVDKLVFPQRTINEQYLEQLLSRYSAPLDLAALLRICVSPKAEMAPIQHLEVAPNTHVFSSPNTDLRFLGAFLKDTIGIEDTPLVEAGGLPAAAVVGFVGYGTPVINAYRVGGRLILNNGHHRTYALRKLGILSIPILILDVSNPIAEMPPAVGGTARELCLGPRPPLVSDFLEKDFSITLRVKDRIRQLTVMMNLSQYDIPALSSPRRRGPFSVGYAHQRLAALEVVSRGCFR